MSLFRKCSICEKKAAKYVWKGNYPYCGGMACTDCATIGRLATGNNYEKLYFSERISPEGSKILRWISVAFFSLAGCFFVGTWLGL